MTRHDLDGAVDEERKEGGGGLPGGMPDSPPCPFCDGTETELLNAFGPHASVASYWCRGCRSPFEFMKWGGGRNGSGEPPTTRRS